jgi:protein-S-isoprenylcysteine O-methyltransferase Ste14
MNGFLFAIPIILVRYGLLAIISKEALKRAAYFPPVQGEEKKAYWIYQITNTFMFIYLIFIKVRSTSELFFIGLFIYFIGLILYVFSIINFTQPRKNGINNNGLYKISRNPMYVAYFIYFLGCSLLSGSFVLFISLIIFQLAVHWIILYEERWCIKEFGNDYKRYMKKVRRYI